MSAMETYGGLASSVVSPIRTRAAGDPELASRAPDEKCRMGWQQIIDDYLVEWGEDLSALEDDDIVPPSPAIIDLACQVAMSLRDEGLPAPSRVVPDGEGGISFERRAGSWFESLNVLEDSSIELLIFKDCVLVGRRRLP